MIAIITQVADETGLDRVELLGGALAESGPNLDQWERWGTWPDISFGLFHQTVRFARDGDQSRRPENIELVKRLYFDPWHASRVAAGQFKSYRARESSALDAWCRYNWPSKNPADNPNRGNYAQGLAKAATLLGSSQPTAMYDPDVPVTPQPNKWACSVYSLLWALHALGRGTSAAWLQAAMLEQGVVSAADGLLRADGAGLVDFVNHEYGELGIEAFRKENATIDDVRAQAGTSPVLIGGHRWGGEGHWVGVRGVEPDGTLILANPADGYDGIHQELRDSYDRLGPFTMVWLQPKAGVVVDPEVPPHPDTDLVTSLQTALAEITRGGPYRALGDLEGKPLREVLLEIEHIRNRLAEIGNQYGV